MACQANSNPDQQQQQKNLSLGTYGLVLIHGNKLRCFLDKQWTCSRIIHSLSLLNLKKMEISM